MRVLSVASEVFPLVKTGGLADVAGALPPALAPLGIDMRVVIPGYPTVLARKTVAKGKTAMEFADLFGGPARLIEARDGLLHLCVLEAAHLFQREGGPYGDASGKDWPDNWRRFAALGKAAARLATEGHAGWKPDLVHAHDWQAALAPVYLAFEEERPATIVTVHNLAFQGQFAAGIFPELSLPARAFSLEGLEYYGSVGFLKGGLALADAITTVSPTYAREIRTAEFGMGLDGLVNARSGVLHGIVNGIDIREWDPASDPQLSANYSVRNLKLRQANRREIEKRFALEADDSLLLCIVSRLTWQKGMDVVASAADALAAQGVKLAVLGSGDAAIENNLRAAAARHRGRIGMITGYDEALSHLLQGGCDAILVPSRFEPCGLTQLYGLRYGCIPVVARTGGLADTVIDANFAALSAGVATGIQFDGVEPGVLIEAVQRARELHADGKVWKAMQRAAMKSDVSWTHSAQQYAALYAQLAGRRQAA
jgi:starch synthase